MFWLFPSPQSFLESPFSPAKTQFRVSPQPGPVVVVHWTLEQVNIGCNGTDVRRVGGRGEVLFRRLGPIRRRLSVLFHIRGREPLSELERMEEAVCRTQLSHCQKQRLEMTLAHLYMVLSLLDERVLQSYLVCHGILLQNGLNVNPNPDSYPTASNSLASKVVKTLLK